MAKPAAEQPILKAPAIILVAPQLGENIGTAARAMANFGLTDLRLVTPREAWPSDKARAAASRADHVIDAASVYASVPDAIADLSLVYATTARTREVAKAVAGPRAAAARLRSVAAGGASTGVLFGRERTGLSNQEVSFADEIITFPVDPRFSSLNIAQAVLLLGYEWRLAGFADPDAALPFLGGPMSLAPKADLIRLFEHLEAALDEVGFFRPPEKRQHMVEALRTLLQRAQLSEQEVRTLRGVVAAFERRHTRPRLDADGVRTVERRPAR